MPSPPTAATSLWRARAVRELVLAALLCGLSFAWLGQVARWQHPDRSDEPEWIAISILHWRQLVLGEPVVGAELDPPQWQGGGPWRRGVQRTMFGYPNPCLPKLVWGGVLHAAGYREASPLVFDVFERHNPVAGQAAQRALEPAMPLARRVVLALAALSAALVFFAGRSLLPGRWGWACGVTAFGLWHLSPLVRATATYIRTDLFMLPFVLGALVLALHAREPLAGLRGVRSQWLAGLLLGIAGGLAVSSKLNGGLVCLCVALWVALAWWQAPTTARTAAWRGPLPSLLIAGAATCLVFYALTPRLWADPLGGVADIVARWDKLMRFFQEDWAQRSDTAVARTVPERFALFLDRTLTRDDPWRALTGLAGGALWMAGGLTIALARWLRPAAPETAEQDSHSALVLLVFVVVFATGTALWLPLDWERFWLPVAPCVVLLEALCLVWLARAVVRGPWRSTGP